MWYRHDWTIGSAVAISACLLAALFMAVDIAAMQRRGIAPPDFMLTVGAIRVAAYTTDFPECPWPASHTCYLDRGGRPQDFYTVWVSVKAESLGAISRPVLSLPIDR